MRAALLKNVLRGVLGKAFGNFRPMDYINRNIQLRP
jgi:hypothetical protein